LHAWPSQGHLVTKKLFSDRAKFAVPKALAPARPSLAVLRSREFLMGTPCLAYKPELPFLAEWCAACGVPEALLRVRRTCDDWFAVGKMVEAGIGFGILPSSMTLDESKVWEVDVPQEDLPSTTFYVVFHSDLKNVPAVQELLRNVTLG
jgi:DNA-binding transcriptional LysR family regulator